MKMSNLTSKLKALRLELGEDMLMHLVLISLPIHTLGNSKWANKWSINELISQRVEEEEMLQRNISESAHLSLTSNQKWKNAIT